MKKRKLRKKRIFITVLFLLGLGILCFSFFHNTFSFRAKVEEYANNEEEELVPTQKEKRMSLAMVGDALIHEVVYRDAYQNGKYDFTNMFTEIKPLLTSYDLKYYNQETIIGGGTPSTYPRFNTPEAFANNLTTMGFNVVSLANNHTLDKGESGILHSVSYWKKKEGVVTAGSYSSWEDRNSAPIYSKNGISYAFLSYTVATNGLKAPSGKEYLVNVYSKEQAKKDVEAVKKKGAEVIMVAMHWGDEYTHTPNAKQKEIASYLSSLGVNLIIGAHPHVIQPISYVGDTLVIYSLGNFISGHEVPTLDKTIGLFVGLDIVVGEDGKVRFENIDKQLLYTYCTSSRKNFKVYPFSKLTDKILKNYESIEKDYLKILDKKV